MAAPDATLTKTALVQFNNDDGWHHFAEYNWDSMQSYPKIGPLGTTMKLAGAHYGNFACGVLAPTPHFGSLPLNPAGLTNPYLWWVDEGTALVTDSIFTSETVTDPGANQVASLAWGTYNNGPLSHESGVTQDGSGIHTSGSSSIFSDATGLKANGTSVHFSIDATMTWTTDVQPDGDFSTGFQLAANFAAPYNLGISIDFYPNNPSSSAHGLQIRSNGFALLASYPSAVPTTGTYSIDINGQTGQATFTWPGGTWTGSCTDSSSTLVPADTANPSLYYEIGMTSWLDQTTFQPALAAVLSNFNYPAPGSTTTHYKYWTDNRLFGVDDAGDPTQLDLHTHFDADVLSQQPSMGYSPYRQELITVGLRASDNQAVMAQTPISDGHFGTTKVTVLPDQGWDVSTFVVIPLDAHRYAIGNSAAYVLDADTGAITPLDSWTWDDESSASPISPGLVAFNNDYQRAIADYNLNTVTNVVYPTLPDGFSMAWGDLPTAQIPTALGTSFSASRSVGFARLYGDDNQWVLLVDDQGNAYYGHADANESHGFVSGFIDSYGQVAAISYDQTSQTFFSWTLPPLIATNPVSTRCRFT